MGEKTAEGLPTLIESLICEKREMPRDYQVITIALTKEEIKRNI